MMTTELQDFYKSTTIQKFKSSDRPKVDGQLSLQDIYNILINPSEKHKTLINDYRSVSPTTQDTMKGSLMFMLNYSFKFKNWREDAGITSTNDLIYLDIDNPDFNITAIDKSKVLMIFRTLSGKNYGILVATQGLTKDNFKAYYQSVCLELGITVDRNKLGADANAMKANQAYCLAYDLTTYINTTSLYRFQLNNIFTVVNKVDENATDVTNTIKRERYISCIRDKNYYQNCTVDFDNLYKYNELSKMPLFQLISSGSKVYKTLQWQNKPYKYQLYYNNKHLIDFGGAEYIHSPNKSIEYVDCNVFLKNITNGKREIIMSILVNNFIWLNPQVNNFEYLVNKMMVLNNVMFYYMQKGEKIKVPLPLETIEKIIRHKLILKDRGNLTPVYTMRKTVFSTTCKMSGDEKRAFANKLNGASTKAATLDRVYELIENWDFDTYGKITYRKILDIKMEKIKTVIIDGKKVKKTVIAPFISKDGLNEPYKELSGFIKDLNNEYKICSIIK